MTTPYKVGEKYKARLVDDSQLRPGAFDCEAVIKEIQRNKMIVSVFCDIWRDHEYNLDGVRLDNEAYLVAAT